jgi:hypothetical protein
MGAKAAVRGVRRVGQAQPGPPKSDQIQFIRLERARLRFGRQGRESEEEYNASSLFRPFWCLALFPS